MAQAPFHGVRRGQSSIELLAGIAMVLLVFAVVGVYAADRHTESSEVKTMIAVRGAVTTVRDSLNTLDAVGPGFYEHFWVPPSLWGDQSYTITCGGNVIEGIFGVNQAYALTTSAHNASLKCLTYGEDNENRAANIEGRIFVTGGSEDRLYQAVGFTDMLGIDELLFTRQTEENGTWLIHERALVGDFLQGGGVFLFNRDIENATFDVDVYIHNSTGDGRTGVIFRAINESTYVSLVLDPSGDMVVLQSTVNGVVTPLASDSHPIDTSTWYRIQVRSYGAGCVVNIDCETILSGTIPQQAGGVGALSYHAGSRYDTFQVWGYRT